MLRMAKSQKFPSDFGPIGGPVLLFRRVLTLETRRPHREVSFTCRRKADGQDAGWEYRRNFTTVVYNTTCSTSRQGRGSTGAPDLCGLRCWRLRSGFRSHYIDDNIGDGPYQFTFHMRPASMNVKVTEITGGKNTKEVLVPPTRIERATRGLGNRCSIQLSYGGVRRM